MVLSTSCSNSSTNKRKGILVKLQKDLMSLDTHKIHSESLTIAVVCLSPRLLIYQRISKDALINRSYNLIDLDYHINRKQLETIDSKNWSVVIRWPNCIWQISDITCQSDVMIWQKAVTSDWLWIPMIWQNGVTNWGLFCCFVKWVSRFDISGVTLYTLYRLGDNLHLWTKLLAWIIGSRHFLSVSWRRIIPNCLSTFRTLRCKRRKVLPNSAWQYGVNLIYSNLSILWQRPRREWATEPFFSHWILWPGVSRWTGCWTL